VNSRHRSKSVFRNPQKKVWGIFFFFFFSGGGGFSPGGGPPPAFHEGRSFPDLGHDMHDSPKKIGFSNCNRWIPTRASVANTRITPSTSPPGTAEPEQPVSGQDARTVRPVPSRSLFSALTSLVFSPDQPRRVQRIENRQSRGNALTSQR